MGYELETDRHASRRARDPVPHWAHDSLERRFERAVERLALAEAVVATLRGRVPADDPSLVAAQLRAAEARRRRRELAEELQGLEGFEAEAGEAP